MKRNGTVYLVGAGPGRRELITVRGLACLRNADWLLYDQLIDPQLLEEAPLSCQKIDVGKRAGRHAMPQEEINALLIRCARAGGVVVRLKGGDPYLFGRGGEEGMALAAAGIPFQVVPGVPSPIGGLAWAGIPVTHRGVSGGLHIVTAHTRLGGAGEPFEALAALKGTLVFLMGLERLEEICQGLLAAGMDGKTPAAVVSHATRFDQRTVRAPLAHLADQVRGAKLEAPAMVVVGGVAGLEGLDFAGQLPLMGERVLIARTSDRAGALAALLEEAGAETAQVPLLRLEPTPGGMERCLEALDGGCDDLLFTSRHTVELVLDGLREAGRDLRSLAGVRLCAVGNSTARALRDRGLVCDMIAKEQRAEGLLETFLPLLTRESRVLLPQSAAARDTLRRGLEGRCRLTAVELYHPEADECARESLRAALGRGEFTALAFTSGAAAERFETSVGLDAAAGLPCFSIGPVTSAALRRLGVEAVEAASPSLEGLKEAMIQRKRGVPND